MRPTRLLLAGAALLIAACTDRSMPVAPTSVGESPLANVASKTSSELWRSVVTGETGPGSLYAIHVPQNWNGDVIYFVHAILPPSDPVVLPNDATKWDSLTLVRNEFGARRFAVAYSSCSENGTARHREHGADTARLRPRRRHRRGGLPGNAGPVADRGALVSTHRNTGRRGPDARPRAVPQHRDHVHPRHPVVPGLTPTLAAAIVGSNTGVRRHESTPDAQNLLEKHYVPTGDLEIPVITVHTRWDYLVPFFHEAAFQQIVQAAGASDMLLQRAVTDYGHCANTSLRTTVVQSVLDLVGWVTIGMKSAS